MSDVFISYSRDDKDFVKQLREAFLQKQQDVWIDWDSIPASQAWWDEIKRGIATAHNFIIVMSPNSMSSPICHLEIEYARELGKRIIPLLHADFDAETCIDNISKRLNKRDQVVTRQIWGMHQEYDLFHANHSNLLTINYFFFKSDDDFAKKFEALFDTINTDFEHKEKHTTLGLRAQSWDRNKRDVSFLLNGEELKTAEIWLKTAQEKQSQPAPTDLHHVFIETSRNDENKRRNRIRRLSFLSTFMTIFAVSAFFAGIFAVQDANNKVITANEHANAIEQRVTVIEDVVNRFAIVMAEERNIDSQSQEMGLLIQKYPNEAYVYFVNGIMYALSGNNLTAIENFDEAIRLDAQFSRAYNNRGIAYADLALYELAIVDYQMALSFNSHDPSVYNNLGLAHYYLNQHQEALGYLSQAIQLNTQYADAYYNRGLVYTAMLDFESANEDMQSAISINPNYAPRVASVRDCDAQVGLTQETRYDDSDGDCIINDGTDACPDEYGELAFQGCPNPDRDGDGVDDSKEPEGCVNAPDEGAGFDGIGCPRPDTDRDGMDDRLEIPECLGLSDEGLGIDRRGCPNIDTDNDGVSDSKEPSICIGAPDLGLGIDIINGCPHEDKDNDGVRDSSESADCLYAPDEGKGINQQTGCPVNEEKDNARGRYNTAKEEMDKNNPDYQFAINQYTLAIQFWTDGEYESAYLGRGQAHFQLQNYIEAIEDFMVVIRVNSDNAEAYLERGNAYYALYLTDDSLDNAQNALRDFRTAQQINIDIIPLEVEDIINQLEAKNQ